jgi:hypothetical protein
VVAVGPRRPVGVDDLHLSRLLACSWHDIQ